jgi:hypothetical protein
MAGSGAIECVRTTRPWAWALGAALAVILLLTAGAGAAQALTISGTVTSQGTAEGVEDVEVVVREAGTNNAVALPTSTAKDGSYAVPVPAGRYDIEFIPSLSSTYQRLVLHDENVTADLNLDIVLVPANLLTISGVIHDHDSELLPHATITLAGPAGSAKAESQGGGSFSVGPLPAGTYNWYVSGERPPGISHAHLPHHYEFSGSDFQISGSESEDIRLPELHLLTVRTLEAGGIPVPNAALSMQSIGDIPPTAVSIGMNASFAAVQEMEGTDGDGYALLAIPSWTTDRPSVAVAAPTGSGLLGTSFEVGGLTEDEQRDVTLTAGTVVTGVVRGPEGAVLPRTFIRLSHGSEAFECETKSDGSFETPPMPPDTYSWLIVGGRPLGASRNLLPAHYEFAGASFQVQNEGAHEEISLPPMHSLTVHVTGPEDHPVVDAAVTTSSSVGGAVTGGQSVAPGMELRSEFAREDEVTDADGDAVLALPDWSGPKALIQITPRPETKLLITYLESSGLNEDEVRDVGVAAGRTVSGVLRDSAGEALPNAIVEFYGYASSTFVSGVAYTNSDGSFKTTPIPTGTYSWLVSGSRPGGVPSANLPEQFEFKGSDAVVAETPEEQREDITLPAMRVLTVRAIGPGGSSVPGVTVRSDSRVEGETAATPVAPGMSATTILATEYETTDTDGYALLSIPAWTNVKASIYVEPPLETQLPDASFQIEGLTEDQTQLIALGKSGTDVTPPELKCATPTAGWHPENQTLACTATDSGTGLAHPEDASFSLTTTVAANEETAKAETTSHRVCDKADNCAEAGPLGPIEIDRKPPTIAIASPANSAEVAQGSSLKAQYTCTDGGSGTAACEGSTPSGATLDTATLGKHTLSVSSTDAVGNQSTASATYTVVQSDTTPPSISTTSPEDGEVVTQGTSLVAHYSCSDSGSGVASCEGSAPSGSALDTSAPGQYTLSVASTDAAQNATTRTVHYTVVAPGQCGESAQLCQTGLGDATPPKVVGITPTPTHIDTSSGAQAVVIAVHATDDLSGVSAVQVSLSNGSRWITAAAQLSAGGSQLDGTWNATLTLPQHAAEGKYALNVAVIDNVGNHHTYSAQELEALSLPSSIEQSGIGDTTPPQISGVSATPESVSTCSTSQTIAVVVQAGDTSGVAGVTVSLNGPGGQPLSASAALVNDGGTATSGRWSASLTLPAHAQQGSWAISIQAIDTAGNPVYISSTQLASLGYTSTVAQTCSGDTAPPQIHGVTFSPESTDTSGGPRDIAVAVHATDDLSGIASLRATLSSGDQSEYAPAVLEPGGTNLDGTWNATIVLPRWSHEGTWQLSLIAIDNVGNTLSLLPGQISALGFPNSIAQIGEGDTTAPDITGGSINPSSIDTSLYPVQIKAHLQLHDAQSGASLVLLQFTSPNGAQHVYGQAMLTSGTTQNGEWSATLEFPQFSQQGGWKLQLEMWDAFGNHHTYSSEELVEKGAFPPVTVVKLPTVATISPSNGRILGGETVRIGGSNFSGATAVHFGTRAASNVTVVSPTMIESVSPIGPGTVDVTVTTPEGTSEATPADQFVYVPAEPAPTISKLGTSAGPAAGGTSVVITGAAFNGTRTVKFGSQEAASFTVTSESSITAIAPPGTSGTVNIAVTTPYGTTPESNKSRFKYEAPTVSAISPASGPIAGGTTVAITGSGFAPGTSGTTFAFGAGEATSVSCSSTTSCTAVSPAAKKASTVDVRASVEKVKSEKTASDQYAYG